MADEDRNGVWLFSFALEKENGRHIERELADELMDVIIQWAEEKKCQVGGGYERPAEDEPREFPLR